MRPRTDVRLSATLALASLFLTAVSLPSSPSPENAEQQKTKQEERKKSAKPELESRSPQRPEGAQKGYSIDVSVDLVVVHTSVTDKNNHFISGLKQEYFELFEDGVAQSILSFSQEDVPVSMGIALDTSGSMRSKFETVTRAAKAFVNAGNPEDEIFLIGFNDEVELLEDYTNDRDAISDSLDNTIVTGGTALFDAIYLAVQKAQNGLKPKKAIVVISDGEDKDSYYSLDELVSKVQESDVQVFSIGFLNPTPDKGLFGRWSKSVPEKAQDALERISSGTGGKAFFPKALSEIHPIVAQIAHELRNQYSIGYISSNTARDGSWRRVKIQLRAPGADVRFVRHRRGYFAHPPSDSR